MKITSCCLILWFVASAARAQIADAPDESVANIRVNCTEAKAGQYTLPDVLKRADGQPVRDAATWFEKRRPEVVKLFEENQYGRSPGRPADMSFDVFEKATPAFGEKATRRQVTICFSKDKAGPKMDLLICLPAAPGGGPAVTYLNEEFFRPYKVALGEGLKNNLPMDVLYDEQQLPTGMAGGLSCARYPNDVEKSLEKVEKDVTGPAQAELTIPIANGICIGTVLVSLDPLECVDISGRDICFFANSTDTVVDATIVLRGDKKLARWDPHTGQSKKADTTNSEAAGQPVTTTHLTLEPLKSVFYIQE